MKKNGRTVKKDLSIIIRGIREFERVLPGQIGMMTAKSILASLVPYLAVVFSAWILNELIGAQNPQVLLFCVLASAGLTLILSCLRYRLEAGISVGYQRLFSSHEIVLTDKAHRLPYSSLESDEVRSLREQVSGSIQVSGAGMASLYWDMEVVAANLCSAVIAAVLCMSFVGQLIFGMRQGMIGSNEVVTIIISVLLLVSGCSFLSCKMTGKRFDVSYEVFTQGAVYNRYGEFYTRNCLTDEDMALDIRIFNQKKLIIQESQQKCYQPFAKGKEKEMAALNRFDGTKLLCMSICGTAVYAITGCLALKNVIGIGDVVMINSAVIMLIGALSDLAKIFTDLRNNNVHLLNYFSYMDMEEETDGSKRYTSDRSGSERNGLNRNATKTENEWHEIRFDHVTFAYPEQETMVLHDVNLRIVCGEKIAIVGENGSGKSTLIKLLCRLYRPAAGTIFLDGRDIWEYPMEEYVKKLSTVFQDFALFAFSLAENVAASESFEKERVYEALCQAGLKKKIEGLAKGIDQAVSRDYEEDGMELSGGEEQKIAIARASYKSAPIAILDEPTAALDPFAEKEIYEQFFQNLGEKTMLCISHRLSSCRLCDRIVVLDQGTVVQQGTHEELMQQTKGRYAKLWNAQAQYYT